ncbi:MAG TPA: hypothetical protein VFQ18_05245 [Candidatus Acidoferrum sp.]|nr:hypothetical protein [Candidatus Acidoferrum sp.]
MNPTDYSLFGYRRTCEGWDAIASGRATAFFSMRRFAGMQQRRPNLLFILLIGTIYVLEEGMAVCILYTGERRVSCADLLSWATAGIASAEVA